jgi:hypothetical protein
MSTGAIIGIVIAVIVVAAIIVVAAAGMRRARLRRQFGPEYDRLAKQLGSRQKADAELAARERRVKALNIRELTPEEQASYSGDWAAIQERFVDTPAEAVGAAHTLIGNVMRDRGYPTDDRTASMDALAVHHSGPMEGYLKVQGLRADSASTEELREAMIRYRAMFEDLTGLREGPGETGRDRVAEIRDRTAGRHAVAGDGTRVDETAAADFDAADRAGADRAEVDDAGVDDAAADRAAADRGLAADERERAARDRELAAEHVSRRADTPR